jgi:hypothetical protein
MKIKKIILNKQFKIKKKHNLHYIFKHTINTLENKKTHHRSLWILQARFKIEIVLRIQFIVSSYY